MPRTKLFRAGCYLAVLSDDSEGFWLCCTKTEVFLENDHFSVVWLEKSTGDSTMYEKMVVKDRMKLESVVSRVTMLREKGEDGKVLFRLPEKESIRIQKMLHKIKNGCKVNVYDDATDAKLAIQMDDSSDDDEPLIGRKRKVDEEKKKRKNSLKNKQLKNVKVLRNQIKKPKVDKSDPNWRLKPNLNIRVWEMDPLFESKDEVPFVSSITHSRLAIRAVILNDMKMLKTVVNDVNQVHNPNVKRSLGNPMTAIDYALKMENATAIKILTEIKSDKQRIGAPACSLRTSDTGTYNYR